MASQCCSKSIPEWISEAVLNQLQGVTLHPADHVSVISEAVFNQLQEVTLHPADRCFIGPGQNQLKVSGQFKAKLIHQNSVAEEQTYIARQL